MQTARVIWKQVYGGMLVQVFFKSGLSERGWIVCAIC